MHLGDLMLSSSILLSGGNYQKVSMMAKILKLPIVSKNSFYKIQRTYLIPAVDEFWTEHHDTVSNQFQGRDITILGDGRMDSPGHTAQYCSYTFMEYDTKTILYIITMDKRVTEKKSTNLEKACFVQGLRYLLGKGLHIVEVVTDAHVQVASVNKKDFPDIRHSFDIWLETKNLARNHQGNFKLSQQKNQKDILSWTKDVNHYWYTATISNTKEEFIGKWIGILHHTVNVHTWVLPYSDINECNHAPLTEEPTKGWLEKDSPAHVALREIVLDKRLQNNVTYYLNCRSTAELENFQNVYPFPNLRRMRILGRKKFVSIN
ncbi:uncharacterized protein LOC133195031 [Saccostrea echinata]|uniref:uncharacterized protein LOC133195031 n=1 Tax=Saccostrea echinata TaxID=191078 RepID=UPI002A82FEFD|nr:uncharacterized protein LOC133195031 [Saccostrea echinata]